MADSPSSLPPMEDLSVYNQGLETDNPILKLLTTLMMGNHYLPRPVGSQSTFDAYLQQARSQNFLRIQANSAQNNQLFMAMGVNPNSDAMRLGGLAFGGPNSPAMQALAPLIGGNPVAAQMQAYAGFTGTTMGAAGRTDNISYRESQAFMTGGMQNFYNWKTFDAQKANDRVVTDFKNSFKDNAAFQKQYGSGISLDKVDQKWLESYKPKADMDDPSIQGYVTVAMQRLNQDTSDKGLNDQQKKDAVSKHLQALHDQLMGEHVDKKFLEKYLSQDIIDGGDITKVDDANLAKLESDARDGAAKAQQLIKGNNQMNGSKVIDQINYTNTRGFNLEDFTQAGAAAADLRLGMHRGESMQDYGKEVFGNMGGVLSAARGIFGRDKNGGQLVEEISRLLGSNATDLGDGSKGGGAEKIEKMLRDMKSTARVAGVSIDAVVGIVKEAQALAQSRPGLSMMSGVSTINTVNDSLRTAQLMNANLSAGEVRRQGGVQGMLGASVSQEQDIADSDITKQIAALSYQFKGNADVQKAIAGFNNGTVNQFTLGGLLNTVSGITGQGQVGLYQMMADPTRQAYAMSDDDAQQAGMGAGHKALMDQFMMFANRSKGVGGDIMARIREDAAQAQKDGKEFNLNDDMIRRLGNNSVGTQTWQQYNQVLQHQTWLAMDPANQAKEDALKGRIDQDTTDETDMSKRMDGINASAAQRLFQKALGGDLSSLGDAFSVFKDYKKDDKGNYVPQDMDPKSDAGKAYQARIDQYTSYAKDLDSAHQLSGDDRRTAINKATHDFLKSNKGIDVSDETLQAAQIRLKGYKDTDRTGLQAWIKANKTDGSKADQDVAAALDAMGVTSNDAAFSAAKGGEETSGVLESSYDADVNAQIEKGFQPDLDKLYGRTHDDLQKFINGEPGDTKWGDIINKGILQGSGKDTMSLLSGNPDDLLKALQKGGYKGTKDSQDFTDLINNPALKTDIAESEKISNTISQQQDAAGTGGGATDMNSMINQIVKALNDSIPKAMTELASAFRG